LKFWTILAQWDFILALIWMVVWISILVAVWAHGGSAWLRPLWLFLLLTVAGWGPWVWRWWKCFWLAHSVVKNLRVGNHETAPLRHVFMQFTRSELSSQPLPNKQRTDDRYELLCKFQALLESLGFAGIIVLVDRVDEPHLINGSAELMKALLWPMLDNKFLKHPGLGLKLMVPIELTRFVEREDRDFYQRARLDKQNMIRAFEWSGEALYDVATARIRACASNGASPSISDLFDDSISEQRLIESMRSLRVPRHLFKFLYHLLVRHCNAHTDQHPVWTVPVDTFESTLALYLRDQNALDHDLGVV
jgi:hypothetical protein